MKKLILLSVLSVLGLTGCFYKGDPGCRIEFVYINNCASDVAVESFNEGDEIDISFSIPANGQHSVTFDADGGYLEPFWSGRGSRCLTISNGMKTVTEIYAGYGQGDLYDMDSYTFISEIGRHKIMQYVFTDDFFADGEPIN